MDKDKDMQNEQAVLEDLTAILTYEVAKDNNQSQKQLAVEWMELNDLGAVSVTDTVVKVWLLRAANRAKILNNDGTAKDCFTMVKCKGAGWSLECRLREHNTDPKTPYAAYDIVFV